jgi:hypothetical protein
VNAGRVEKDKQSWKRERRGEEREKERRRERGEAKRDRRRGEERVKERRTLPSPSSPGCTQAQLSEKAACELQEREAEERRVCVAKERRERRLY